MNETGIRFLGIEFVVPDVAIKIRKNFFTDWKEEGDMAIIVEFLVGKYVAIASTDILIFKIGKI